MLEKPLTFIADNLDNHLRLRNRITGNEKVLVLSDIVDDQGKFAIKQGTVGLSLINIEEERVNRAQTPAVVRGTNGAMGYVNPEIRLNLQLLFVAHFKDYADAIRYISAIIGFFQANNVFSPQTHPELSPDVTRIVFELGSHGFEQLSYIWGVLGTNYRPSVLYKMRLVTIQEGVQRRPGAPVVATAFQGKGRN